MEEAAQYKQYTKEELIQIIVDLNQTIVDLKKEIEALKPPVPKDSTNSSIPPSKDLIPRTRSQREKSGKKPGGQQGHVGHHRERHPHPDSIIMVQAFHCADCGASLEGIEGTIIGADFRPKPTPFPFSTEEKSGQGVGRVSPFLDVLASEDGGRDSAAARAHRHTSAVHSSHRTRSA